MPEPTHIFHGRATFHTLETLDVETALTADSGKELSRPAPYRLCACDRELLRFNNTEHRSQSVIELVEVPSTPLSVFLPAVKREVSPVGF